MMVANSLVASASLDACMERGRMSFVLTLLATQLSVFSFPNVLLNFRSENFVDQTFVERSTIVLVISRKIDFTVQRGNSTTSSIKVDVIFLIMHGLFVTEEEDIVM